VTFRQIGVEPDLDFAIFVDADEVLGGLKVADETEESFEAIECAEENI
jgi:hypothetical protein